MNSTFKTHADPALVPHIPVFVVYATSQVTETAGTGRVRRVDVLVDFPLDSPTLSPSTLSRYS